MARLQVSWALDITRNSSTVPLSEIELEERGLALAYVAADEEPTTWPAGAAVVLRCTDCGYVVFTDRSDRCDCGAVVVESEADGVAVRQTGPVDVLQLVSASRDV
jgi:hypothetical protein